MVLYLKTAGSIINKHTGILHINHITSGWYLDNVFNPFSDTAFSYKKKLNPNGKTAL